MIGTSLMQYRSRETYDFMVQLSMPVIIPRINEMIASAMAMPYRILLLVKHQILRDAAIQSGIALVYRAYLPEP